MHCASCHWWRTKATPGGDFRAQALFVIVCAQITNRLESHPCIVTVPDMGAARHFLRTTMADKSQEERYSLLQPTLEVNPKHPIITKLHSIKDTDPELAKLVAEQVRSFVSCLKSFSGNVILERVDQKWL